MKLSWSAYFAARFDRGVGLRRQSRCATTALVDIALGPGAHHADVEDPRVAVLADIDVAVRTYVPWYHSTL